MTKVTFAAALARAIGDALDRDDRVIVLGNHFGGIGPLQKPFDDLHDANPDRMLEPPWSEMGMIGTAVGAACTGLRPLIDVASASFVFQGFAQLVNEAPNVSTITGGKTRAPMVVHMLAGIRSAGAAQHSHSPQAMLWNTPGLRIVLPSCPADAYDLMLTSLLESEDPTVFMSHPLLFGVEQELDWPRTAVPAGIARIARAGSDATIVASTVTVPRSLEAAEALRAEHGIDAEVIDLRSIVPFDEATVTESVERTGRLVVADECHRSAGVAAEVIARIVESSFGALKAPPVRVTTPDVAIPFSPALEQSIVVSPQRIVDAVLQAIGSPVVSGS